MNQEQRNKKAEQLRLAARIIETGCKWELMEADGRWITALNTSLEMALYNEWPIRIKETVIPIPEGWRELRDDEKDGMWIEGAMYLENDGTWEIPGIGCYAVRGCRIIVPVANPRVPLEPCDIPPGTCIKPSDEYVGWGMICEMDSSGVHLGESRHLSFKNLMDNNWSIKRPTDTEWQPCSKEAP